jgi:Arc/MetJ family transcription regulator
MRTTLNLDEQLVEEARRITGTQERTALIHEGLRALIARKSAKRLARLGGSHPGLEVPRRRRAMHPFVIGELACGTLRNRDEVLYLLAALPAIVVADPDEVLHFIEERSLMARGMGYIDPLQTRAYRAAPLRLIDEGRALSLAA